MNHISNARQIGESFKNYRARLKVINKAIRQHMKGRLSFESTKALVLPPVGEDPKIDEAFTNDLERGLIRDVTPVTVKTKKEVDGKLIDVVRILRYCRAKGVTYRKYGAERRRKWWRKMMGPKWNPALSGLRSGHTTRGRARNEIQT